jgi:choline-glycine betaine transporter
MICRPIIPSEVLETHFCRESSAFSLGMILTFLIFFMERSSYILNLMVQTTGYYFQYSIFQLPFHSDAFGQLREGEGRAIDGNAAATWWMDAWTIFYVSKRFNCV